MEPGTQDAQAPGERQWAVAGGVGSMPGEDIAEAVRVVLGELPDLPHLPELPARGAGAGMTGRGVAMITELGFDLQPAGWRLTDGAGVDQRRARSLLGQDLDVLEELAQGYQGDFKVQVIGPWTMAATAERPRGDRLLADHGARREVGAALAEGVAAHLADLRRRVPGARWWVQVDEPALPAVLAARVPTASGFGRHRSVAEAEATELLGAVLGAVAEAGATPLVHCCAERPPIELFRRAGAAGISADLAVLAAEAYDPLAAALEDGLRIFLGVVGSVDPPGGALPSERSTVETVLRLLDMLGFGAEEVAGRLVLTPACGLAGATPGYARAALTRVRVSAARLQDG